ncbi:MAG: DISARM system SNF2-like helicase DrmD [Bryobacterales bacterium]|nr:DISARM system SNF2-like helicase DrmD [Bryobacterales bacterium]MDE0296602.1 DISARM system SNF2-like helicase DrmD [Bryobacterales bacterium]
MTAPCPEPGQIALVRQRRYLVENVTAPSSSTEATLVDLSCLDDDAQGESLSVLWEHELDACVLEDDGWSAVAEKGFDDPELFAAYLRTLSWNCLTATDPNLFQAPFRAGIRIDAYQLDPLRKALRLPRVNLFIADDVGVGKTIEAGLIARELLLRRRIDRIVVACPPSMLEQWLDEMETRFGLTFTILDRNYVTRMRRERGFSVNPWTTNSRFLVSHRLLIDEAYASGLRDWLGEFAPQSLLILDEAHNAAPASGARYAVDSQITRAVRDIAPRFEHRLFLSATPHNGHSNSFSALLEILDPQRFCRGVRVRKGQLDEILVRRLKSDIRQLEGGFPKRTVVQVDIDGLHPDAPELVLPMKLDSYRLEREKRLKDESRSRQAAGALVIGGLQKRLLSSIEAFAKTLAVHRKSVERALQRARKVEELTGALGTAPEQFTAGEEPYGAVAETIEDEADLEGEDSASDDWERSDQTELELTDLMARATTASSDASRTGAQKALMRELDLVDEMREIAEASRYEADPRIRKIVEWIEVNMCTGLSAQEGTPSRWNDRRLIIFTEYEDTRRFIQRCLSEAIAYTDRASERIATFTGLTSRQKREDIKHAFNTEPKDHPIRILIATDAAREGLNLQRHCRDLFHFDLPWNPSRLDQRNGRIDRKLQPAQEVFCRYFVFVQRPEDRVLKVLVKKAERVREELGSVAKVLEGRVASSIEKEGMRRDRIDEMTAFIRDLSDSEKQQTIEEELEESRLRQDKLQEDIDGLRTRLERSCKRIGISAPQFRQTLSMSLRLAGVSELVEMNPGEEREPGIPRRFTLLSDNDAVTRDPGWAAALDTLRDRKRRGETFSEWRRRAIIRPVAFEDTGRSGDNVVQLHLEHRVTRRLLGRFTSQGLIHHDLSKACLTVVPEAIPRVVLIGRLAVYGPRAARLHEEILPVAARWIEPVRRQGVLTPYGRSGEQTTLASLQTALDEAGRERVPDQVQARLATAAQADIADLLPHLKSRAAELTERVKKRLAERAEVEGRSMTELLQRQRKRILEASSQQDSQMTLDFDPVEQRQREADRRAWARRLLSIETELETEPKRIAETYTVRAVRVDPLGLVYLWPRTG